MDIFKIRSVTLLSSGAPGTRRNWVNSVQRIRCTGHLLVSDRKIG